MFDLRLSDEQKALRRLAREFTEREIGPIALAHDRMTDPGQRTPWAVLRAASKLGLRTLSLPEELGGGGVDDLTSCIVTEELAVGDVGVSAILAQTSYLSRVLFFEVMSPEQRDLYLDEFLSDDDFHLAVAGHEPDTDLGWQYRRQASDRSRYKTTAVPDGEGNWILNGVKTFITNVPIAKLNIVHARTRSRDGQELGMTSFLVRNPSPGLEAREGEKVGRRLGPNGELAFVDCVVPGNHVLGEVGRTPLTGIVTGRHHPRFQAMNLGVGRAAYEAALAYAKSRTQGGELIANHQAVGLALGKMAIELEAARSLVWQAAWLSDHRDAYSDGSVPDLPMQRIAKVFVADAVMRTALEACQIFGGSGVMSEVEAQKYVRDALIFMHSEMTQDVAIMRVTEDVLKNWNRVDW